MPEGFSVDLAALQQAAEGVTDTLNTLATKKVSDIDADKSAFGHDKLGGTVSDFCERWQIGVEHLAKDGQEVADRLNMSVNAYTHVERTAHANMQGILQQSTGPDPAAQ
ncbi:hypothetical protein [Actinocrispum wychmicini]|uniref:Excreted virulence factor EspC (Type VII ESX diderm) n=1 Tax=Actinocrispum wychmicini TaxID=1213861 RepID=A0A4R2JVB1_9PSEU|nr:hypothetical protein [Actinocrispum wychmicini]TCO62992.1 hypothetical protein EV192_1021136 [Actinocrispum wychmicini]